MLLRCRACPWGFLPTPSHRAASAAKGKGSAVPVRRRRKTVTLAEMFSTLAGGSNFNEEKSRYSFYFNNNDSLYWLYR